MIPFDFTTTATNRIDIVEHCYASFHKNLEWVDWNNSTLLINIDPVPLGINASNFMDMCSKYFGQVIINIPDKPNYTQAYKWVYRKANSKLIFNLEDDFILTRKVDVRALVEYFNQNKELYSVSLRVYPWHYQSIPTSPQILHKRFYKIVGEGLDPKINPEVQLRGSKWGLKMPTFREGYGPKISEKGKLVVYPEQGGDHNCIVKDIGREWSKSRGLLRTKEKKDFVTWERKDNG